jgi:hypothetical protein
VSAAAIFHLRPELDRAGFDKVKIVASSGFGPGQVPCHGRSQGADRRGGFGSFLPSNWTRPYATADIVEYDGVKRIKIGREFLHRNRPNGRRQARIREPGVKPLHQALLRPRACSTASHLALEESGAKFDSQALAFAKNEQKGPEYLKINPRWPRARTGD